jgi:hypothetical protein
MESVQKTSDDMAHGWWRSTYTYMRAKHCVRMHLLACHECRYASRAEFVSDCWSKQYMYIAVVNHQMDC